MIISEDSPVREAVVHVARPGKPSVLLRRPVQCLYPLKVPHVKNSLPTNDIKIDGDNHTKEFAAGESGKCSTSWETSSKTYYCD